MHALDCEVLCKTIYYNKLHFNQCQYDTSLHGRDIKSKSIQVHFYPTKREIMKALFAVLLCISALTVEGAPDLSESFTASVSHVLHAWVQHNPFSGLLTAACPIYRRKLPV